MRINKIGLGAGAFTMLAGLNVAGTADAAASPGLTIVPEVVQAGHWVEVTAHCPGGGATTPVTSDGLAAPIRLGTGWSGQGPVVERPGRYTASVTCADGAVQRVDFTVTSSPPSVPKPAPGEFLRVVPTEAAPGQRVDVTGHCDGGTIGPVMSEGFVAPVQLNTGWQAQAQAVDRPGRYRVSQTCGDGATVWAELSVSCVAPSTTHTPPSTTSSGAATGTPASATGSSGQPPSTTTTESAPPSGSASGGPAGTCVVTAPPTGSKPQVPVKPKGAPETGGGGMADAVSRW